MYRTHYGCAQSTVTEEHEAVLEETSQYRDESYRAERCRCEEYLESMCHSVQKLLIFITGILLENTLKRAFKQYSRI